MRYAVIMAGGSGTRLWPLSRQGLPKQLLELFDGKSLLQVAWERTVQLVDPDRVLVCTGAGYEEIVQQQLPELLPHNLLGEPEGRDSLNAAAWPAAVLAGRDPDAVIAMLTADHVISPVDVFVERINVGFQIAEERPASLVTFGVIPTSPKTGFGYLERGAALDGFQNVHHVLAFKEKPDLPTAKEYLASGNFEWNSGMFVWRAQTFLEQLALLQPKTHQVVLELAAHPDRLSYIYPRLFKTSIDYAIMEPVSHGVGSAEVVGVALPIDWADVGSFQALAQQLPDDADGNSIQGQVVALESHDNLLINNGGEHTVLATIGVSGLVVVHTPAATLVAPLERSEQVKQLALKVGQEIDPTLA